jgi:hypothetical protein
MTCTCHRSEDGVGYTASCPIHGLHIRDQVPSGTPSIWPWHRFRIILRAVLAVLLLLAVLKACDVDLTFFEDGSGMVSWCEPFNPCMEYKP